VWLELFDLDFLLLFDQAKRRKKTKEDKLLSVK
jgi:hypothetical protein